MHVTRLASVWALITFYAFGALAADDAKSSPRYIIYYNSNASPLTDVIGLPYTHIILTFISAERQGDEIVVTVSDNLKNQLSAVPLLQAVGQKVMISFGGGLVGNDDYLPLVGHETALAAAIAEFVELNGLDGVDIDFEVSAAFHQVPPTGTLHGVLFLTKLTLALRAAMGPQALISHAPQGPFLDPSWHGGPYLQILRDAGDSVDWINIQYYNNPGFNSAIVPGDPSWSYAGLTSGNYGLDWPPEKTVVTKPVYIKDAGTGHLTPEKLSKDVIGPLFAQYGTRFGGLAGWQFSTHTDDHIFWNLQMADVLNQPAAPKQPTP